MNLNDSQIRAVEHFDGPCLVLAGPGSGKTAVLTLRVKRLIERGIKPSRICVITFTKAAASEMAERFRRMSNDGEGVLFATFHSLFFNILAKERGLGSESIVMGSMRKRLLKEAADNVGFSSDDPKIFDSLSSEISAFSNYINKPEAYEARNFDKKLLIKIYGQYNAIKGKNKLIDFDDMLTQTYELFISNAEILARWQARFDYFLVDEAQDMNELQYVLLSMLGSRTKNIFCVGDDDQSIYGFRGASPELLQRFVKDYEGCCQLLLNVNYRCPSNVVENALKLISNNSNRFDKTISAFKSDGRIEFFNNKDQKSEAKTIIKKIKELSDNGTDFGQIAVLYRNHSEANFLVSSLIDEAIPFYLKDRLPNIYTHFIVNDIVDFFQIAVGNATRARMLNIINKPNRFIQRASLERGYDLASLLSFYKNNSYMTQRVEALFCDLNLISKMNPLASLTYIRAGMGYEEYIKEKAISGGDDLDDYLGIFDLLEETIKDCKTIKQAIDRINYLKLKVDYENKSLTNSKAGKVGLYTLHSSKGLEFDNVFIIGANEGIIPGKQSEKEDALEAERRLFYVGVTRTKLNLYISFLDEKNRNRMYPSRFINEFKAEDYSSFSHSS